eukprot:1195346-Prorocentrum_minimum.AAC.4
MRGTNVQNASYQRCEHTGGSAVDPGGREHGTNNALDAVGRGRETSHTQGVKGMFPMNAYQE